MFLYVCCISRSSSSPVIFVLVFPFLFYPPFFLLLFLFEVSSLSLYVASSSVVSFLLSLTRRFLLLPVSHLFSYVLCPTDLLRPTPYPHFKGFQSCDVLLSQSPCFCTVQGRTSNQCFHHYFLEASSYFSILPLVMHFSWKRLLSHCYPMASILGAEGRDPIFWAGGRVGVAGGSLGSWTGREILLNFIMYRKYVRKWLLLKRNRIIWPEVAVNGNFCLENQFFNCLKKLKFFGNLPVEI